MLVKRNNVIEQYNFGFQRFSQALDGRGRLYGINQARFDRGGLVVEEGTSNLAPSINQNRVVNGALNLNSFIISSGLVQGGTYTISGLKRIFTDDGCVNTRTSITLIYSDATQADITTTFNGIPKDGNFYPILLSVTANSSKTLTSIRVTIFDYGGASTTMHQECKNMIFEQKAYNTSYHDSTRAAEVVTVSTNDGVQRKNLCPLFSDSNWYKHANATVSSDGRTLTLVATAANQYSTILLPCIPGASMTISFGTALTTGQYLQVYSAQPNGGSGSSISSIGGIGVGLKSLSFVVPAGTYYVKLFCGNSTSSGTFTFVDMQLELGTTATSYQPYGARLAASEGTVERMFRLDRPPGTNPQYLFDAGGIQHYVNPAGKLECTYNSGAITITGTTTLSAGTIYTASLRFDATGVAIHLAGVQEASSVTALSTDLSALAYEGCKSDGTCQLDGVMFDAVYNTISRPDADLLSRATAAAAARRYADDASVSWHANFDRPDSIRTPRVVNL